MTNTTQAIDLMRPRWRSDASGFVARFAGEWAGPAMYRDALNNVVRGMPNGAQIESVEVTR